MFNPAQIDDLKRDVKIQQVLEAYCQPVTVKGKNITGRCPKCSKDNALKVHTGKNIATCFHCDPTGKKSSYNPLSLLHFGCGKDFKESVEILAQMGNVILDNVPALPAKAEKAAEAIKPPKSIRNRVPNGRSSNETFRDKSLRASGIEEKDQITSIHNDKGGYTEIDRYTPGTFDERYEVTGQGDDMVMRYVGLDRQPMQYSDKRGRKRDLVRVRYAIPEAHPNKYGDPVKYMSPPGSSSDLWLPETIIRAYENGAKMPVLYVQEGEKKADRATKAGLPSVGIMGIHNLVGKDRPISPIFELIVKRCDVESIVFLLDADWQELGRSEKAPVDMRPRSFLSAVSNFRNHFYAFASVGINLNIYFGHVLPNSANAKGIDDVLAANICTDAELRTDAAQALANMASQYIRLHNITNKHYTQLQEHWHLQNVEAFSKHYRDALKDRKTFIYGRLLYRWSDKGTAELAQPIMPDEQFWSENYDKRNDATIYRMDQRGLKFFLDRRGFSRYDGPGGMMLIKEEDSIIDVQDARNVKDFVRNWLEQVHPDNRELWNMIYRTGKTNFTPEMLDMLRIVQPALIQNGPNLQHFVFSTGVWRISSTGIEMVPLRSLGGKVWRENVLEFAAEILEDPLVEVRKIDDEYISWQPEEHRDFWREKAKLGHWMPMVTELGQNCDFLKFLYVTSNFHWRKEEAHRNDPQKNPPLTIEDLFENAQHFLAKITAFGYLNHRYRDPRNEYAIMAIEGDVVEGGRSEGGTGKSMLGYACKPIQSVEIINGKAENLQQDQFLFGNVTERTGLVVVDDVRREFDLEYFFPQINGDFRVRPLGKQGYTIPREVAPKMMVTSNFFPKMHGNSYERRLRLIAYSDFFNGERKPVDYFERLLLGEEWDTEQWNMFYNLTARCVQHYLRIGEVVQANDGRLLMRRMMQEVGQTFMDWADEYFVPGPEKGGQGKNMDLEPGIKIEKAEPFETGEGSLKKRVKVFANITAQSFKRKLWLWALIKGYRINPHKPYEGKAIKEYNGLSYGGDDKSGSKEYLTIISRWDDDGNEFNDEGDLTF